MHGVTGGWETAIMVLAAGAIGRPALSSSTARARRMEARLRPGAIGLCGYSGFVARLLVWATRNCPAAAPRPGSDGIAAPSDHS